MLKIDRSFVARVADDEHDVAIVRNILALARDFGIGVTAEGVETEQQRDTLLALGCHIGQGYLFARPAEADVVRKGLSRIAPDRPPAARHRPAVARVHAAATGR